MTDETGAQNGRRIIHHHFTGWNQNKWNPIDATTADDRKLSHAVWEDRWVTDTAVLWYLT